MKERIIDPIKKQFLNKRHIIETINDQLKRVCPIVCVSCKESSKRLL